MNLDLYIETTHRRACIAHVLYNLYAIRYSTGYLAVGVRRLVAPELLFLHSLALSVCD